MMWLASSYFYLFLERAYLKGESTCFSGEGVADSTSISCSLENFIGEWNSFLAELIFTKTTLFAFLALLILLAEETYELFFEANFMSFRGEGEFMEGLFSSLLQLYWY